MRKTNHIFLLKNQLLLITKVLSAHRKHKIYVLVTMRYSLGSDDPEELTFYKKIKEEIQSFEKNIWSSLEKPQGNLCSCWIESKDK